MSAAAVGPGPRRSTPERPPVALALGTPCLPRPAEVVQAGWEPARQPAAAPLCPPPRWYLHVLPQRAGVRVGLVAHLAQIGLIGGVDVHVLLPVTAVGEAPVAALKLTLERLLACGRQTRALAVDTQAPWGTPTHPGGGKASARREEGSLKQMGPLRGRTKMKLITLST